MDGELVELHEEELLVFAGLARALVRLDGQFSQAEAECLEDLSTQLTRASDEQAGEAGPYRAGGATREPIGPDALYAAIDRASTAFPDDAALRGATRSVTRPEARLYIHAMLHALACADFATKSELDMLDWLAKEWSL